MASSSLKKKKVEGVPTFFKDLMFFNNPTDTVRASARASLIRLNKP